MSKRFLVSSVLCLLIFAQFGCGVGQQLVSIQVSPTAVVFGGACPGGTGCPTAQLTAIGTYTHPPATKDITSQVTWKSDVTAVAVVSTGGVVTAGPDCGVANITASTSTGTANDSLITSIPSNVTVDGPSTSNCPSTQP